MFSPQLQQGLVLDKCARRSMMPARPLAARRPASRCAFTLFAAQSGRNVRARVLAEPIVSVGPAVQSIDLHLNTLKNYYSDGVVQENQLPQAVKAAEVVKEVVAHAVNTKSFGLRSLQSAVVCTGLEPLIHLAKMDYPIAYEALQILCYRNSVNCQSIVSGGVVETISHSMDESNMELQSAMCFLLTAVVAFSDGTHEAVINAGLVPPLVQLCRLKLSKATVESGNRAATLQTRAAAVLRNLAHNTKNHSVLIQAGAVDALAEIMRTAQDPPTRINAAVAVACLVGHEEGNPKLQLDEELVVEMLEVLDIACQGGMKHGIFWTVWKLCQGLASLSVNDRNKELITARGGIEILAEVLFGKHHNNEAAHRFALSAIWNLAFNEDSRQLIVETPGLVEAIRTILATTESSKTKEVAKGALWTLGLEQDVKNLQFASTSAGSIDDDGSVHTDNDHIPHVMLSYEWGCQQSVMLIKSELEKAGYKTWMDIDKMSGSTLEAMARAVEESAVVLVCVSKKYKESQACRTEAEYAFQQRKKIIPLLMEANYKPSGWLGAIMGTRLYFSMSDSRQIPAKMPALMKELGDGGRINPTGANTAKDVPSLSIKLSSEKPETWTHLEVEDWLKRIKCGEFASAFREKDMDGVALSGLYRLSADAKYAHETLENEFGIHLLGQRLRIVEELHKLFN